MSDVYYIVDLSRTKVSESVVFWRENGYGTVDSYNGVEAMT